MQKITLYLPADLKDALARLARETHRSEADLIREAIRRLTVGHAAPEPTLPLFCAEGEPIADRIDEVLADGFGR